MTQIPILPDDTRDAASALARLQQKHGAPRTMGLAAAQIRADADYLAKWTGPSVAAQLLAAEAHRLVSEAAAGLAAPAPQPRQSTAATRRRLLHLDRAAVWSVGILTAIAIGLGLSAALAVS